MGICKIFEQRNFDYKTQCCRDKGVCLQLHHADGVAFKQKIVEIAWIEMILFVHIDNPHKETDQFKEQNVPEYDYSPQIVLVKNGSFILFQHL